MGYLDRFSEATVQKARGLVEEGGIRPDEEKERVYRVKNYLVHVHEGGMTTCTCPNGLKRAAANCYHSAAALMLEPEGDEDEGTWESWEVIE